jgi:hypothetical protein
MPALTGGLILSACALNVLVSCSNGAGPGSGSGAAPLSAAARPASADACERQPIKIDDVAGILSAPVTEMRAVPGDAQSCEFSTAGFPAITISIRPGLGSSTVEAWIAGRMPLTASRLAGVGEAAVWQAPLQEVIAQQHDLLCDIQVRGGAGDIALASDALPQALGALCNRIFAAG